MNRMKTKKEVVYKPLIKNARNTETVKLCGYNISLTNDRISTITSRILMLSLESSLYCLVSLGLIKPDECQRLFGVSVQDQVLEQLNKKIKTLMKEIKEVVQLNTKFCTWMFGIQSQIFNILINFQNKFNEYVAELEGKVLTLCNGMKTEM
jgi:hypothetical protein